MVGAWSAVVGGTGRPALYLKVGPAGLGLRPVTPFVGSEWLTQLDAATEQRKKVRKHSYSGAHFRPSEVHGWRGTDARVYYLSPWEFMKWWELKKLQPPTTSEGSAERGLSEWVPSHGQSVAQSGQGVAQSGADKSAPAWKFGKDYRWREPLPPRMADKIVRLPAKNASQAAAAHYLQRRQEPVVPFPTMCPLPKSDMLPDAQARLFNVYLRPWTLDVEDASTHVPHIDSLDLPISALQASIAPARRLRTKTAPAERSHAAAWKDYVESHVVSEHAGRTIRNFLAAAECGADEDEAERHCAEVDTTWVDVSTVHRVCEGGSFQYSARTALRTLPDVRAYQIPASLQPPQPLSVRRLQMRCRSPARLACTQG